MVEDNLALVNGEKEKRWRENQLRERILEGKKTEKGEKKRL